MTPDINRYKKALKHALPYGRFLRKRLMESFHFSLMTFMEEEPNPDIQSLYTAFGPPSEMAKLLTASLTEKDIQQSKKKKITARIFTGVGIVVAALLLATVSFSKPESLLSLRFLLHTKYIIPGI